MITNIDEKKKDSTFLGNYTSKSSYAFNQITDDSSGASYTYSVTSPAGRHCETVHSNHTRLHHHDYFEVVYVLNGEFIQHIENETFHYSTGHCCILNRNINHSEDFIGNVDILFMMLTDEFLEPLVDSSFIYSIDSLTAKNFDSISHLIRRNQKGKYYNTKEYIRFSPICTDNTIFQQLSIICEELVRITALQAPGFSFYIAGLITHFFSLLESSGNYKKTINNLVGTKEEYLVNQITQILLDRKGRIYHSELEQILHYNAEYMNRIIKKSTGMTLTEYKDIFMMQEVARLLIQTNASINNILFSLNITNKNHFYHKFKKRYSMSPGEYRKSHQHN